ncbi:hypothetical protein, partial [Streptomyces sp. NPDC000880]
RSGASPWTSGCTECPRSGVATALPRLTTERNRFEPGGDLSGAAMGRRLGQTAQNGRKVRIRLLKRYAANTGQRVDKEFNVEELVTAIGASKAS